jgi:hypothetical protein
VLLLGTTYFAGVLGAHYPLSQWLVWRYLGYWLLLGVVSLACVSSGYRVIGWLAPGAMPLRERLVTSFAVGLLLFSGGIFGGGLLHLLGWPLFVALPAGLFALGARDLWRLGRHLWPAMQRARGAWSPWRLAAWGAGLVAVLLVYASILSPDSLGYDARWYHLPIAEHYAAQGRIARFPEGWFLGAYPHLSSYLYTWAFLMPKSQLFDHVELSYHLEFLCFLWALAAIPSLVRALLPGERAATSWVSRFLFPAIFLYDANLNGGADHVAALWSIPIATTLLRAWQRLTPGRIALFTAMLSGAILTKYSVYCILPFPVLLFCVRCLMTVARPRPGEARSTGARALGIALLSGAAFTSPHWLKNWAWYGDPFYPILHARLGGLHPWSPLGAVRLAHLNGMVHPAAAGWAGVQESLKTTLTFSFVPNDWDIFHKDWPVFGSLFTLTLFTLPFLRRTGRIWLAQLGGMSAVFIWYEIHHYDRFLQIVVPWMAGATAATLLLLWRSHAAVRVALVPLVGLQILAGLDVPFYPTHNLLHDTPLHAAMKLAASGFLHTPNRLNVSEFYGEMGRLIPEDATVLVHESPIHLGLRTPTVNDEWQGGLDYGALRTPKAIHQALRSLGVTHVVLETLRSHGRDSWAADLAFFRYFAGHCEGQATAGWLSLARLPATPPPETTDESVLYLGCGPYKPGYYDASQLSLQSTGGPLPVPRRPGSAATATSQPRPAMIVHEQRCGGALPDGAVDGYIRMFVRGDSTAYLRLDAR